MDHARIRTPTVIATELNVPIRLNKSDVDSDILPIDPGMFQPVPNN
jgi:hypothetical protein